MVDWLAGNRVRGTSTERTTSTGFNDVAAISGGWKELARTTLGSANATIDVTSLSDKRYYMILCNASGFSSGANTGTQLNADTGNNYARRNSNNGGADGTEINFPDIEAGCTGTVPAFQVGYLANKSDKEKLLITHLVAENSSGAGTAPFRNESVGKWANTSSAVSSYQWITSAAATFDSGSECVVLGWDPADTHTTNFWEELASVELGSAGDVLSSGTITAKKYLWVQFYVKKSGSIVPEVSFNNTTGSEYNYRHSDNGGSDLTQVNKTAFRTSGDDANSFVNMFIINNSSNEKLAIVHSSDVATTGAGNAPTRREIVAKWTNTSSQITKIDIDNVSSGNFDTGSIIKVWGSN